jgi:nitroimidazol reductase NimA-like FMN-containing flavoprotein (pyridoxamine 5'-phosphate oxidase superfamily)
MNDNRKQILNNIADLFESQKFAVLSTQQNDQPYSSLVAFAVNADLNYFYFLTPNATRKYENLKANPKVCILVNNIRNNAEDIYNAVSVTGTGVSEIIDKSIEQKALDLYLRKHPNLKKFSKAPTTAFIRISMHRYFMVNRFQNVVEVKVEQ